MIEKIVKDYLKKTLGIPVLMEKPKEQINEYVLVIKTGSSKTNFINSATIALQSYAESMSKASALNERVKQAMDNMIVLDEISKSKLNTDYPFTDTQTKKSKSVFKVVPSILHSHEILPVNSSYPR